MTRIVVTEYPRSGGSWVVGMLGDALELPKRDIYVRPEGFFFDARRHPWYSGYDDLGLTPSCVIKSHELPDSRLIDFPAHYVHLIRDGRDVVVSRYHYERYFCPANGLGPPLSTPLQGYTRRVAAEWAGYVRAWQSRRPVTARYEGFLANPAAAIRDVLSALGFGPQETAIRRAVENNSLEKFRASLDGTFKHDTPVRKGIAGDWRNHFTSAEIREFKAMAGEALLELGYEKTPDW